MKFHLFLYASFSRKFNVLLTGILDNSRHNLVTYLPFVLRTSKILIMINFVFLRFSASKVYYTHIFYEIFLPGNDENNS